MERRTRLLLFLSFTAAFLWAVQGFQFFKYRPKAPPPPTHLATRPYGGITWGNLDPSRLALGSGSALVADRSTGEILYEKDARRITPIASITKLMTAMVLLDAGLPFEETVTIGEEDVDTLRGSLSHLPVGWTLTREDALLLALMSSENRAASALARNFPGGTTAFVAAMNAKAQTLGMGHTSFLDPHGLHSENVSTAEDLLFMVDAACRYGTIRRMTTTAQWPARALNSGRVRYFGNSNGLVHNRSWTLGLSKTGFIRESGFCLVMETQVTGRPVVMILLDSAGKFTRLGDAARIRKWLEEGTADLVLGHASGRTAARASLAGG